MKAVRSDIDILEAFTRRNVYTTKEAKELVGMPILEVPIDVEGHSDWGKYYLKLSTESGFRGDEAFSEADLLFRSFCAWFPWSIETGHETWIYFEFLCIKDDEMQFMYQRLNAAPNVSGKYYGEKGYIDLVMEGVEKGFAASVIITDHLSYKHGSTRIKDPADPALDDMRGTVSRLLVMALTYSRFNLERHRYRVGVNPKNPGVGMVRGFKQILTKKAGPRIIYLDKLPTTPAEAAVCGEEGSKGTHVGRRRAYRKTLSADRYKNHPKYKVYKGVYVRDTWIGPRQTEVAGNIYKVMEDVAITTTEGETA